MSFVGAVNDNLTGLHSDPTQVASFDIPAGKHQGRVAFSMAMSGHPFTCTVSADPGSHRSVPWVSGNHTAELRVKEFSYCRAKQRLIGLREVLELKHPERVLIV
jgi:hypothetical protein